MFLSAGTSSVKAVMIGPCLRLARDLDNPLIAEDPIELSVASASCGSAAEEGRRARSLAEAQMALGRPGRAILPSPFLAVRPLRERIVARITDHHVLGVVPFTSRASSVPPANSPPAGPALFVGASFNGRAHHTSPSLPIKTASG